MDRNDISVINDEITHNVSEAMAFLSANGVKNIEVRTIGDRNVVDLSLDEVKELASSLRKNNLKVSAVASPLFKWYRAGVNSEVKADTFFFNPYLSEEEKKAYIKKAIGVARILGTDLIRIFSTLRPEKPVTYDLLQDPLFSFALDEAKKEGIYLALENEPPCFVHRMADVRKLFDGTEHPALKLWFDIANFYRVGDRVSREDLEYLSNAIRYFHLKDFDANNNYVQLGRGIINYKRILSDISSIFEGKDIYLSLETHVKESPEAATLESLIALRGMLGTKRLRYGIVGCGDGFTKHIDAISKQAYCEIGAVFDIDANRSQKASESCDCEAKNSLNDLLRDPKIDVVNIRTPHNTHKTILMAALKADKDCLCEKPMCLNHGEGEEILNSEFYHKNVFVNYQYRFNKSVEYLFELLEKGKLGNVVFCSAKVRWWRDDAYFNGNWRGSVSAGGGMLFNQGSHIIDIMRKICGPIKHVDKKVLNVRSVSDVDDIYVALLEFESGTMGNLEVTTYTKYKTFESSLFIIGENGSISLGGTALDKISFISLKDGVDEERLKSINSAEPLSHEGLIGALNSFLLSGTDDSRLCTVEDALETVKAIEKLYGS